MERIRAEEGDAIMPKKVVVVNAGPRKGWNTDTLLMEAAKGKSLRGTVSAETALLLF